ncbi:hypothetical protein CEUSTIGMA_g4937.t1 [Chlamydomonas eustigma]|uniref:Uncharacterized protein n=1 Tax=Chlamydomonas eustigma TaxID=1157962 RepID=A0A250X333_9CHLO|nr:hypothetical protein CEUSTIGMA_g4937.t1 [Chlamydomonas eustigma]|eukprot:GAX77493.1 hypothetical protein CEUSTIGMA_g4937.t1 [Chlamydomonas eustigma]
MPEFCSRDFDKCSSHYGMESNGRFWSSTLRFDMLAHETCDESATTAEGFQVFCQVAVSCKAAKGQMESSVTDRGSRQLPQNHNISQCPLYFYKQMTPYSISKKIQQAIQRFPFYMFGLQLVNSLWDRSNDEGELASLCVFKQACNLLLPDGTNVTNSLCPDLIIIHVFFWQCKSCEAEELLLPPSFETSLISENLKLCLESLRSRTQGAFGTCKTVQRLDFCIPSISSSAVKIIRKAQNLQLLPFACSVLSCGTSELEEAMRSRLGSMAVKYITTSATSRQKVRQKTHETSLDCTQRQDVGVEDQEPTSDQYTKRIRSKESPQFGMPCNIAAVEAFESQVSYEESVQYESCGAFSSLDRKVMCAGGQVGAIDKANGAYTSAVSGASHSHHNEDYWFF